MKIIFWTSLAVIMYIYLGYPFIITFLAKYFKKAVNKGHITPSVTLLIAAYNEDKIIAQKLDNCLSIDYPKDKLEIIVVSDGSDDRTNEIVEGYKDKGIRLHPLFPRRGKTSALNKTLPIAKGEIIVFSDANVMYKPDSLKCFVRNFSDDSVGVVTGDVKMLNEDISFGKLESLYYDYERFIQSRESDFFSCIGVDGAMYAVRRDLFSAPSDGIILDDFVISMNIARKGYRIIYEPESVSAERSSPNLRQDFVRKVRIAAGGFQALKQREGLPRLIQGKLLFCYLSHKLLRWLSPFFLIGLFTSNFILLGSPLYHVTGLMQLLFYFLAFMGLCFRTKTNVFYIPFYFCVVNAAQLLGFFKALTNRQTVIWEKADR
jgi:cellulose synthase/poly-beta-1,6-N-acetylglucosamine synthase-like glycosyltransferase